LWFDWVVAAHVVAVKFDEKVTDYAARIFAEQFCKYILSNNGLVLSHPHLLLMFCAVCDDRSIIGDRQYCEECLSNRSHLSDGRWCGHQRSEEISSFT